MTIQGVSALDTGNEVGLGRRKFSEIPLAMLLLAPSLIVFGVFIFYPLVRTIRLGFYRSDPFGGELYVGWEQYWDTLRSGDFHHSLWITVLFALLTVGFGLLIGLSLAILAHQRLKGITIFRTIFSSTVATSVAVSSLMWLVLFQPSIGVFNQFLDTIGHEEPVRFLLDTSTALFAVAATTVWQNLGITFIILIAGLQGIPDDLYESARVDGASAWLQFREITIPMLSPTLLFASVILTINAFKSFGQIDLLTEGGPSDSTNVIVYSIYQEAFENRNPGVASAQAVILFLILLLLTLTQFTFFERRVHYAGGDDE
ncbi:MAG TPA: sugar ABC transporter permease [Acidimicrobiales bacterium]|nr:sugar ABC transporter permease [Acidimicrobiales bacterium]